MQFSETLCKYLKSNIHCKTISSTFMAILVRNKNINVMVIKTGLISSKTNFSTPACVRNVRHEDDRTEARMEPFMEH